MTAPSLWQCLTEAGVPREHRPAASVALVRFIDAHTREMRAAARAHRESVAAASPAPQEDR